MLFDMSSFHLPFICR